MRIRTRDCNRSPSVRGSLSLPLRKKVGTCASFQNRNTLCQAIGQREQDIHIVYVILISSKSLIMGSSRLIMPRGHLGRNKERLGTKSFSPAQTHEESRLTSTAVSFTRSNKCDVSLLHVNGIQLQYRSFYVLICSLWG